METVQEIQTFLETVTTADFRGRLLDRGSAWSLMRREGELPLDAPKFGDTLQSDLADYAFSLLLSALSLREKQGDPSIVKRGFEFSGKAFEALVKNNAPDDHEADFYRIMAASAYHLASYSAVAYSLLNNSQHGQNTNIAEQTLSCLILRDFRQLHDISRVWLRNKNHQDEEITRNLLAKNDEYSEDDAYTVILNSSVCRALLYFDFALQTGRQEPLGEARTILRNALNLARDTGIVTLWWVIRLSMNLIDDLWAHSLHVNLPTTQEVTAPDYAETRERFIRSLYARKTAEVELWPSQLEAAKRAGDMEDDLVVALPTSAGKTRIAEIAALVALSSEKRVLLVTPLRALSAQTERSFRKTFAPLGYSVSSLYGASGSSNDADALRSKNIVITTPEKLDFALRNDPTLIDDIGLIVLDEGHMIGTSEREIRYEILVQKLLRRGDAGDRRLVCLSAILPDGKELDDLTAWMRSDAAGSPIKSPWRPTRQRFGVLVWSNTAARLEYDGGAFFSNFIEKPTKIGRWNPPPKDVRDLTLLAAWKFAEQGKKTLIFISTASWVSGYGKRAIELVKAGYLPSLLDDENSIQRALTVGKEWLGEDHPAVQALKIGVAVHHGQLPNPFLRELELLLASGTIKVIAASPTLSQGLNINAAVLLVPYLTRNGEPLKGEEFANVAGRAGRAFVDVEGIIIHTIFELKPNSIQNWRNLLASARTRHIQSGLYQVINEILRRLAATNVFSRSDAFEYLVNSRDSWNIPQPENDDQEPFENLVEKLDAMVIGLINALDANAEDLPRLLDEALNSSLWARCVSEAGDQTTNNHRFILQARANLIWNATTPAARKSHYAMGVGLNTGLTIDAMADELAVHLDAADLASLSGDNGQLIISLTALAEKLLSIRPFKPNKALPTDWKNLLLMWVSGANVPTIGWDNMEFIEDAFAYRLVWALEALRQRRTSLGWTTETIDGGAAAVVETGVPHYSMALLIRAGLSSRRAAITAVTDTNAVFYDMASMREWLDGTDMQTRTDAGNWPTPETASLWTSFYKDTLQGDVTQKWRETSTPRQLDKSIIDDFEPTVDIPYRVEIDEGDGGTVWICNPDYERLIPLKRTLLDSKISLYNAVFKNGDTRAHIHRYGQGKPEWSKLPE